MPNFHLTEPFPSTTTRIHSGRGGAGNTTTTTSVSPSSRNRASASSGLTSVPKGPFTSGRGGAGNVHQASERAIFSFDEELERLNRAEKTVAPVCHIGRGGAGNYTRTTSGATRTGSVSSSDSGASHKSSSMDWVRGRLGRS